ncbi:MAG: hypothetical protein ACRC1W_01280 [Shewanella sp.]
MKNNNVFLGTLTHNNHLHAGMARAFFLHATQKHNAIMHVQPGSLLAQSYNQMWCRALNNREKSGIKWFAILHADIIPENFWLDKLIAIAEKYQADLVSAIVPIKEASGVTSTAISGVDPFTRHTRLTQSQINSANWPKTFDINILRSYMEAQTVIDDVFIDVPDEARLLVNTGCFVCRLDKPWSKNVAFTINDRITEIPGGTLVAEVEPEDWYFSQCVADQGGRVMATREVITEHIGSIPYVSDKIWGNTFDKMGAYQK